MRWESESDLRGLIEVREQDLLSEMMKFPTGAFTPSEEMVTVMMNLYDLEGELEYLRDNRPGSGEPDALVCAPFEPLPHLSSGAVALPEPDEPQH